MRPHAVSLVFALWGCANFERLAPGQCGNGAIDPGEDCDRFAPTGQACGQSGAPDACRFVCDETTACPPGWGCRRDGVCHHAVGQLREASVVAVEASDFTLADVDGDRILDVVTVDSAALRVQFGDGAGGFGQSLARLVPVPLTGRPSAGDLDRDGRADIAVPYREGVTFLAGRADRTLSVLPVAAYTAAQERLVPFRAAGPSPEMELIGINRTGEPLHADVTVFAFPAVEEQFPPVALDGPALGPVEGRIPIDDDDADGDDEVLVAVPGGKLFRCTTEPAVLPRTPSTLICDHLEVGALRIAGGAPFADATGDGTLDVIAAVGDDEVAVLSGDGAGAYGPAEIDSRLSAMGMPLAAGDLDGDGTTDWVTPSGVYLDHEDSIDEIASFALEPVHDALVASLSASNTPDVVVAGDDWMSVLLNAGGGVLTERRVPVDGRPFALRTGSFDGDRLDDVVFAEHREGVPDSLVLLFGEADSWPTGPFRIARVADIAQVEVGYLRDNSGVFDGAADIGVMSAVGAGGQRPVALFLGAADRNLSAPLALVADAHPDVPEAVFLGGFAQGGDSRTDVVAVGREPSSGRHRLWAAGFEPGSLFYVDRVASALLAEPTDRPARCAITWAAGDRDGDGTDELVGLDCEGTLRVFRVEPAGTSPRFRETATMEMSAPAGSVQLELLDLDDDARMDLVVHDGDSLRVVWADTERGMTSLAARAVARLSANEDAVSEIGVLTGEGVFVGSLDGSVVRLSEQPASRRAWSSEKPRRLRFTRGALQPHRSPTRARPPTSGRSTRTR